MLHEFVTVNRGIMLETGLDPDVDLSREVIATRIDGRANNRREARLDQGLSAHHHEDPVTLWIAARLPDAEQIAPPQILTW